MERSTTEPKGPSISTPWDCTANSYLVNGFRPPMRMSSPELPGEGIGLVPSDRPQARQNPRQKPLPPARPHPGGSCLLGPQPPLPHTAHCTYPQHQPSWGDVLPVTMLPEVMPQGWPVGSRTFPGPRAQSPAGVPALPAEFALSRDGGFPGLRSQEAVCGWVPAGLEVLASR